MLAFLKLVDSIVDIYIFLLIAWAILSWLVHFNVVNTGNRLVYVVMDFLYKITEPALRQIRRVIPLLGGIDVSPIVLILGLIFLRDLLFELFV